MALNLTELQAATNDYWKNKVVDSFFEENVLLWKLMGKGGMEMNLVKGSDLVDGGSAIREFIEHDNATTGSYGAATSIPTTKKEIINAARFRWAGYFAANTIGLAEQRDNNGKAAMVDLIMAKMTNIEKTIRDKMGSEVYAAAANADSFLGLGDLFDTTTADAYGEIAEDDMALWKANLITTAETITFKVVQEIWRAAAVGQTKSKKPDLAITTEVLKDSYERTLQVQQRFSDESMVKAGFDNVLHKGAPICSDDNQAAGTFDAINSEFLKIKTHSKYNFTAPVWEADHLTPDTLTANTRWIGQLICSNRRAHCRHTGLEEGA